MKKKLIDLGFVIDNEYLDKYCELIEKNKNTVKEKFKTQIHHIVPRYTKINNNETVNLSHKDHCLAHYYLCFCSSKPEYKFANENAVIHVFGKVYKSLTKSEIDGMLDKYNEIRIERNKQMSLKFKGKKRSPETIAKMIKSLTGKHYGGKPMSEEMKKHLSEVLKGKPSYIRTPEHKKLMSERMKGHKLSKETKAKISATLRARSAI